MVGSGGRVGWLDKLKIRLNSAQIGVGVGAGAELGKIENFCEKTKKSYF